MAAIKLAWAGSTAAAPGGLLSACANARAGFEGLFDPDAAAAEAAARRYGARWPFPSLAEMLREVEPDLVIVADHLDRRADLIRQCLRARASVLCVGAPAAKPAAVTRLAQTAARADRTVMIACGWRLSPAGVQARGLVEAGRIGEPLAVECSLVRPALAGLPAEAGLPVDRDLLLEAFDTASWLVGRPRAVYATSPADGMLAAVLGLGGRASATVWVHRAGETNATAGRLVVRGAEGRRLLIVDGCRLEARNAQALLAEYAPRLGAGAEPVVETGVQGTIDEAVAAAARRRQPVGRVEDLLPAVAAVDAAARSLRNHRPASVADPRR